MPRMVAFLRGINVGGHRVTSDELAEILADLGMTEAATYRASGNLMFSTDLDDLGALREALERGLADALGYEVPVLLRSGEDVREVAAADPFADAGPDRGKHQVIFMRAPAGASERERAEALVGPREILAFVGSELHWSPSVNVLDSDIDLDGLEKLLGPTTMRTMGTVQGIAGKLN